MLMLGVYLISLPGTFITILPFYKFIGSQQLKQFLLIFVSATPLSLINTMIILGGPFTNVASFIYRKMSKTIWLLFFTLICCWFLGNLYSIFLGQEFMVSMSYALVGIFGGNQQNALNINQLSTGNFVGALIIGTIINIAAVLIDIRCFLCLSQGCEAISLGSPSFNVTILI